MRSIDAKCFMLTFPMLVCLCFANMDFDSLHREKRQLLWPNQTVLQFNVGIGTPTPVKTIQANWAFQANFMLPWNRTQIPTDIFFANTDYTGDSRQERDTEVTQTKYENDAKLYHFYEYVGDILNSLGHNGTACVLLVLCQLGREPLHSDDEEDLLHELATFALNPNHDIEEDNRIHKNSLPYIEAFNQGARNEDCAINNNCKLRLIDMFSRLSIS